MTIAVIGAFYLGEYPEAAVVIVLYVLRWTLGRYWIENSKSALDELVSKSTKKRFYVKAQHENVSIDKIAIGTIIQVKAGEMIPLDGTIIWNHCWRSCNNRRANPQRQTHRRQSFAGTLNKKRFHRNRNNKTFCWYHFLKNHSASPLKHLPTKAKHKSSFSNFQNITHHPLLQWLFLVFVIPVFVLHLDSIIG